MYKQNPIRSPTCEVWRFIGLWTSKMAGEGCYHLSSWWNFELSILSQRGKTWLKYTKVATQLYIYIFGSGLIQRSCVWSMVTLFQIGCLPETLLKRTRNISRQFLASFSIRHNHQLSLPKTRTIRKLWEKFDKGSDTATNILSPKAPSTVIATIVWLWFRDGYVPLNYLCDWYIDNPKYIQNNRGIRNAIYNDAPKDFCKTSRKVKSDIVFRKISMGFSRTSNNGTPLW